MKPILYITIFILGFTFSSAAQNRNVANPEPAGNESKIIKYYPNPAVTLINFEFQKGVDKDYSFQIYNFLGKKILDVKSFPQKLTVPLADYYRGVYIYQLRDRDGKIIESGKFQVNK